MREHSVPRGCSSSASERGWPDEFDLVGNRGSVQSQLGNSVPPPLAHAVAFATRSY